MLNSIDSMKVFDEFFSEDIDDDVMFEDGDGFLTKIRIMFYNIIQAIKSCIIEITEAIIIKFKEHEIEKKMKEINMNLLRERGLNNKILKGKGNPSDALTSKQVLKLYKNFIGDYAKLIRRICTKEYTSGESVKREVDTLKRIIDKKYEKLFSNDEIAILTASVEENYVMCLEELRTYQNNIKLMGQYSAQLTKEAERLMEETAKKNRIPNAIVQGVTNVKLFTVGALLEEAGVIKTKRAIRKQITSTIDKVGMVFGYYLEAKFLIRHHSAPIIASTVAGHAPGIIERVAMAKMRNA